MSENFVERRSHVRRRVHRAVMVTSPMAAFPETAGVIENLSSGGILLSLERCLSRDCEVGLIFEMPTLVGDGSYPVRCRGKVLRVDPWAGKYTAAVTLERIENLET